MPTPALQAFLDGLTLASPRDEAYDLSGYEALDPADQAAARAALLARAQAGDGVAAHTLGLLGDPSVAAGLRPLSQRPDALGRAARRALIRLGFGAGFEAGLAAEAKGAGLFGGVAAVQELGWIDTDAAFEGLLEALEAADSTVRSVALDALIERAGLHQARLGAQGKQDLRTPLERLAVLLESELEALWRPAARTLQDLLRRARAGASPASLGLVFDGGDDALHARFGRALRDPSLPLPVAELKATTPHQRAAAEAFLARALEREDERAPPALAALDARWTRPAMAEVRARLDDADPFAQALDAAIANLSP